MSQARNIEYQLQVSIKRCFLSIVMGSFSDIIDGWAMLKELQEDEQFNQFISCEDVLKDILSGDVLNVSEVPKIMSWSSPYIIEETNLYADPISNNVAILLQKAELNDMSQLAALLETMLEHRVYLPKAANHTALCEAVIMSLSIFQMPSGPTKILEFNYTVAKIQNFLQVIYANARDEDPDIMTTWLQTVYNVISDVHRKVTPGPGLAAILHLVEPFIIAQSVEWILSQTQSNYKLIQALIVLFNWLPKWRGEPLSIWIMEFIYGLEKQEKYSILLEVVESSLDISDLMYKILLIPLFRQNSSIIIFHVLKRISSSVVIRNIIKKIPLLIQNLMKEDSDSSRECIQNLVDYLKAIGLRNPQYCMSEKLENMLPMVPRMHIVKEICKEPIWVDETVVCESMQIPQRHSSEKIGLSNLGNTCYMNSVLQALFMTRQFCYDVLNYATDKIPLLRKLQDLFVLLLYSKRTYLSSTEILQALRPAYFLPGQQQDSSEFLCYLLDVLHEQEKSANMNCAKNNSLNSVQCKTKTQLTEQLPAEETEEVIKRWTTEEDLTEGTTLQRKAQSLADFSLEEDKKQVQLNNKFSDSADSGIQSVGGDEAGGSLIHRVLGGESKITLQCARCDTCSHNTDKFRDLQLCFPEELQESQEISVQDLINYYLRPEKLTDDNRYQCDKCTALCDAQRIITILQAPTHMILSLKHFRYDSNSRLRAKLSHKVIYNDTIKLPVSTGSNTLVETYHLYAAVVHSGHNMDYGHYFTYARDSKQNWYKFNDSYVCETSLEEFKNLKPPDTPYILFYEKSEVHDKIYEDSKLELSTLNKHLQELVAIDTTAFAEEIRQYMISRCNQYPILSHRRYDNSDDENPPSSNCRNAIDIPANRFLY